jgi:hypothetical protein
MTTHTLPRKNCINYYPHHPHDWAYHQVVGADYYHFYRCLGIKKITIVTWEDEPRTYDE